jgi:hypothetical protein
VRALIQVDVEIRGENSKHVEGKLLRGSVTRTSVEEYGQSPAEGSASDGAGSGGPGAFPSEEQEYIPSGLVQHLAESPFHGFADWPTVAAILPDLTKLVRMGHVIMLDRSDSSVNSGAIGPALDALENKYRKGKSIISMQNLTQTLKYSRRVSVAAAEEHLSPPPPLSPQPSSQQPSPQEPSSKATFKVAAVTVAAIQPSSHVAPMESQVASPDNLMAWLHRERRASIMETTNLADHMAEKRPVTLKAVDSLFSIGPAGKKLEVAAKVPLAQVRKLFPCGLSG